MGLHPLLLLRPRVRAVHDGVAQGRGAPVRPLRRRAGDVAPERVVGGASSTWSHLWLSLVIIGASGCLRVCLWRCFFTL